MATQQVRLSFLSFYNWYNILFLQCLAMGKIIYCYTFYLYVQVPVTGLQSRHGHCAAAFTLSPGIAEVVLFGGSTSSSSKLSTCIAETTVLKFGKYTVCMTWLVKALV